MISACVSCSCETPSQQPFSDYSSDDSIDNVDSCTLAYRKATKTKNDSIIIDTVHTYNLIVYYPHFTSIDLCLGEMPNKSDESIIFCCAAAYTSNVKTTTFSHDRVDGNHVSHGVFHKGTNVKWGAFTYFGNKWNFVSDSDSVDSALHEASQNNGMGFCQMPVIVDKEKVAVKRNMQRKEFYRALCEHHGRLCIADSNKKISLEYFQSCLEAYGMKHAIYLDMGTPWNYSWYRDNSGTVHDIHSDFPKYGTNWIVFYK